MGKFPFKRPRIISKKFPEMDNHIDAVTKSLESLVFSYSRHVDRTLQKKHLLMTVSSLSLLVVLGSFFSPLGKADSVTFHPETCLGGWISPRNAEGDPETTSNADPTQFTEKNSAVLPKNSAADIYCGNFTGKFDEGTKPVKMLVSLSLTEGQDLSVQTIIESAATSTALEEIVVATTTEVEMASSTLDASSTLFFASTTESDVKEDVATSTPSSPAAEASSVIEGVVESFKDTVQDILDFTKSEPVTDTVVIPPPQENTPEETSQPTSESSPTQSDIPPTSFLIHFLNTISHAFITRVFAEEVQDVSPENNTEPLTEPVSVEPVTETSAQDTTVSEITLETNIETQEIIIDATSTDNTVASTTDLDVVASTTPTTASTTETIASSTEIVITQVEEPKAQTQNEAFLEVFYTFDGENWQLLGELNEISMKYRSFEIPIASSTSWSDMSNLQIKIAAKGRVLATPTVYLDAMTVEVLYENAVDHIHPNFKRDTILSDETINDMRIVRIINNDTNEEEVWYMYLETSTTSEITTNAATTSEELSSTSTAMTMSTSSLLAVENSTTSLDLGTVSTSSLLTFGTTTASTTKGIKPLIEKNRWYKFGGSLTHGLTGQALYQEIKKYEEEKAETIDRNLLPDFARDVIKKMKGTFFNSVIVQIERDSQDELWLYKTEGDNQEKIDVGTSTSVALDTPLGVKDGHLFWLSRDRGLVYAYNLATKELRSQPVPPFNISEGERAEVNFEGLVWKVIISSEGFTFYSNETGEIFSDENSETVQVLRTRMGLDTVLDKEELSNLNLPVERSEATTTETNIDTP